MTGKGSRLLDTVIGLGRSVGVVVSPLFSDVCVWMDSEMCFTGCLCLQLAAMAVIAVAAEYWISNRKGRSFKDAEFGTTGK